MDICKDLRCTAQEKGAARDTEVPGQGPGPQRGTQPPENRCPGPQDADANSQLNRPPNPDTDPPQPQCSPTLLAPGHWKKCSGAPALQEQRHSMIPFRFRSPGSSLKENPVPRDESCVPQATLTPPAMRRPDAGSGDTGGQWSAMTYMSSGGGGKANAAHPKPANET